MITRSILGPACFGLMVIAAAALLGQEAAKKAKIPDDKAQAEAMALVREVYKEEYGQATTAEKKAELAEKLLHKARDSKDDPTNQFVLLRVARDLAAQAGDCDTAFHAIEEMAAAFSIDTLEMNVQALTKAASVTKKTDGQEQIVEAALTVINQAVAQDKYDVADRLGRLALTAAHKARDAALVRRTQARIKEIATAAKAFEEVEAAMKTLEEKPLDAEANLVVGKHLCFMKGNWKQGRSMLALGGDAALKALAMKEMQGPADAAEQVKLGDAWWNVAEKETVAAKKNLQARAGYWYKKALPELSGLVKDKVEKRLAEVAKLETETENTAGGDKLGPPPRLAKGNTIGFTKPGKDGWLVVFRSSDPSIWNTDTQEKERFALKLSAAPDNIRYLRMRTAAVKGEVIIPIQKDKLNSTCENGNYGWNGTNTTESKGNHLGIYCLQQRSQPGHADVTIFKTSKQIDYKGCGFGHRAWIDDVQGYSWLGGSIPQTVFEIAVSSAPLTKKEQKFLLK